MACKSMAYPVMLNDHVAKARALQAFHAKPYHHRPACRSETRWGPSEADGAVPGI